MKTHTTTEGDTFLQTHILKCTPWMRQTYQAPANPLPADRCGCYIPLITLCLSIAGLTMWAILKLA